MLIKLADLHRRQRRQNRQPCLIGKAGDFWLMIVDRHDPKPGEPAATLFIGTVPTAGADNKPPSPVWDDKAQTWIGPAHPDYPG